MLKQLGFVLLIAVLIFNSVLLLYLILKPTKSVRCSVNYDKVKSSPKNLRIVGGTEVISLDNLKFVAALVVKLKNHLILQCGCSIISKFWVLTAAHCVGLMQKIPEKYIYITAGNRYWKNGTLHKVIKMIPNKRFVAATLVKDTALIKVKESFDMFNEVPAKVADEDYQYIVNSTARVLGWGIEKSRSLSIKDMLFASNVTIFDDEYCTKLYGKGEVTKDMFCAGSYEGGKDACQFDSGGPIEQNNRFIGVVSWGGEECGRNTQPGVYAKVSYFIDWIREVEDEEGEEIVAEGIVKKNNQRSFWPWPLGK